MNNKDKWSALSMTERADLIKLYVSNGITNINNIRKHYNSFGNGGRILDGETEGNQTLSNESIYYDFIEPSVVKAFESSEDYNRYQGAQFGKKVAEGMNNAAPYVLEAAMLPFTISGAVETPMMLYQGVKALPQLVKGTKTLLTKGKKAFGKKVLGMVDDMNGYVKEGSHFRIVDKPAIDDAVTSGVIRSKTGLYHGVPEYLRANFSKYLDDIPGWESMDANKLKELLESKGAFNGMSDAERRIAKFKIGNSTNHGGTVGYFKNMPYPNYNISSSNYVIETPESIGSFVAGHGGEEYIDIPLKRAGATLLKTNGSVKGASIPTKGSSYWEYSPFWEMWKNNKFATGGPTGVNKSSSYSMDAVASDGNKYVDIITTRENDAYNALLRKGYSIEDARRLSPILTAQSLYETGWKLRDADNNYAGYLSGKNKLKYESADEFWDSHLNNLSERWPNWDTANSVEDYYNIVNQTQLGLKSKAEYDAYKKAHPNTFIYSPEWENSNYKNNLLSTSRRVNAYLNRTSMNKDFPLRELPPQMIFGETLLKTPFFAK